MSQDNQESNSESNSNWSKRELGALWLRQGKKQKYLTGYIESDDLEGEKKRILIQIMFFLVLLENLSLNFPQKKAKR